MDYTNIKEKMEKCINVYNEKLSEVRAGRANPAILNKVKIDYYGTPTPINQVAGVSVPEARLIVIQPWDMSILKEIEKAILASDIGINPNNDGKVIRLAFPELTEERRKDLVKDIKKMAEEAKVAVRSVRRDGIETAKAEQKEVTFTMNEEEFPCTREDDGIWRMEYTLRTGIQYVQLKIDDVEVVTPLLPITYGYSRPYNYVALEMKNEEFYQVKDVPHGSVRREYFFSKGTQADKQHL